MVQPLFFQWLSALLVFLLFSENVIADSGIKGIVSMDPAYPVCKVGEPCDAPVVGATLRIKGQDNTIIKHVTTNNKGRFRLSIKPGRYIVTLLKPKAGSLAGKPNKTLDVSKGKFSSVSFVIDTGIR